MKLSITIAAAIAGLASAKDVCHAKQTEIGDCAMSVFNSIASGYGCEETNSICHCNSAIKIRFDGNQEVAYHCGEAAMKEMYVPHHMWCKCVSQESHKSAMATDSALIEARAFATTPATTHPTTTPTTTGASSESACRAANQTATPRLNRTEGRLQDWPNAAAVPLAIGSVAQIVGVLGLFAAGLAYL